MQVAEALLGCWRLMPSCIHHQCESTEGNEALVAVLTLCARSPRQ